jgi:hypothetical protein
MRKRLIQKGVEQVARFSWKVAAERVLKTYELVAADRPANVAEFKPVRKSK